MLLTKREKVLAILARLARFNRTIVFQDPDVIERNCSDEKVDFYYFWIVQGGMKNGNETR